MGYHTADLRKFYNSKVCSIYEFYCWEDLKINIKIYILSGMVPQNILLKDY